MRTPRSELRRFKWGGLVMVSKTVHRIANLEYRDDGGRSWVHRWVAVSVPYGKPIVGLFLGYVTLRDVVAPRNYDNDINAFKTFKTHRAARVCFRGRRPVYALVTDLTKAEEAQP